MALAMAITPTHSSPLLQRRPSPLPHSTTAAATRNLCTKAAGKVRVPEPVKLRLREGVAEWGSGPNCGWRVNGCRAEVMRKVNLGSEKGSSEAEGDEEEAAAASGEDLESMVDKTPVAAVKQVALWAMAGVYTCWLFLLPYAPGDPVWAISSATVTGILDLSLNFFYVLPLANMVGFHLLEAAVAHPADEALFNFVLGWALLFAPLIFTDRKRNRFPGSLDVFWLLSMFLTNTFMIPYMAIRLNASPRRTSGTLEDSDNQGLGSGDSYGTKSALQRAFISSAHIVAATGGVVGILSIVWFITGRPTGGYGDLGERWSYFMDAISRDRPSYAFIWDLCCYTVFQPWLIGDNLDNIRDDKKELLRILRFVPYVGLIGYCLGLKKTKDLKVSQSKFE